DGLLKSIPQILVAAAKLIDSILTSFWDIDWIGVGKDVVNGIIDGLASMGGVLWDAAKNLASKALDSMLSFFDIHSPSKRVRDQVGKPIALGMAEGMEDAPGIDAASKELSKHALSS